MMIEIGLASRITVVKEGNGKTLPALNSDYAFSGSVTAAH